MKFAFSASFKAQKIEVPVYLDKHKLQQERI